VTLLAVTVDADTCIGSGECVLAEPDVFALGEDGAAFVLDEAAASRLSDERRSEIARNCPSGAISVNGWG
jgi:ferredoxin